MRDPWASERVKKDRSDRRPMKAPVRTAPAQKRSSNLLWIAGIGVGGWFLWSAFKNKANAATPPTTASSAGNPYTAGALNASVPGVSFDTSPLDTTILRSTLTAPALNAGQLSAADNFWNSLSPVSPPDSGYITFPSGSQVPASLMHGGNTRMDQFGTYYVQWGGQVYQLGMMDSAGNWPALPVQS